MRLLLCLLLLLPALAYASYSSRPEVQAFIGECVGGLLKELGLPFRPSPSPGGGGRWHREKLGHLPQLDTRALRQLNSRPDKAESTADGDSHAA